MKTYGIGPEHQYAVLRSMPGAILNDGLFVDVDARLGDRGARRPLFVGELDTGVNPDPERALYPYPASGSGGRLCKILGVTPTRYLGAFDRANLCHRQWSDAEAVNSARKIQMDEHYFPIVLLGWRACKAFGVSYKPFTWTERYLILPHPSGRCRLWNDNGNVKRARTMLREAGVVL